MPRAEGIAVDEKQCRPGALDAVEHVEAQIVEVLTGGLPALQFGIHGAKPMQ
jgi:hypothetical protein